LSEKFKKGSHKCPGKSKYQRVPILTELKNPYSIHFIEQLSGMEDHLSGTSLHLSTAFSTGAVFSGSFLDSFLATITPTNRSQYRPRGTCSNSPNESSKMHKPTSSPENINRPEGEDNCSM
ncbi:Potassium Channel Subfamily U Member 1, partial [Manis pentadactyla]